MAYWFIGAAWIVCGILSYGITFAYFQREYPLIAKKCRTEDRIFAVFDAFFGPIGLITSWMIYRRFHGFKWR